MPKTRLNSFQTYLAKNNPNFTVNKNKKNVRVARKNISKNNLFATFRNNTKGNTLTVQSMYTYNTYKGKGYQKTFLKAAENAARKARYSRLNATSVYVIMPWNKPPTKNNEPASFYLLKGRGFNAISKRGKRGVYNTRSKNSYSVYLNKLL